MGARCWNISVRLFPQTTRYHMLRELILHRLDLTRTRRSVYESLDRTMVVNAQSICEGLKERIAAGRAREASANRALRLNIDAELEICEWYEPLRSDIRKINEFQLQCKRTLQDMAVERACEESDSLRLIKEGYKVQMATIDSPRAQEDVEMLPKKHRFNALHKRKLRKVKAFHVRCKRRLRDLEVEIVLEEELLRVAELRRLSRGR